MIITSAFLNKITKAEQCRSTSIDENMKTPKNISASSGNNNGGGFSTYTFVSKIYHKGWTH